MSKLKLKLDPQETYFWNAFFSDQHLRPHLDLFRELLSDVNQSAMYEEPFSVNPDVMEAFDFFLKYMEELWLHKVKASTGTPLVPEHRVHKFELRIPA